MDINKFVGEDKDIIEKLYENPVNDEVLHVEFDFKAYLALEPTEEYKNNQERIKREQDESKGIFKILSTPKGEEPEETKTEIKIDE
jgi:hypothetical protein